MLYPLSVAKLYVGHIELALRLRLLVLVHMPFLQTTSSCMDGVCVTARIRKRDLHSTSTWKIIRFMILARIKSWEHVCGGESVYVVSNMHTNNQDCLCVLLVFEGSVQSSKA